MRSPLAVALLVVLGFLSLRPSSRLEGWLDTALTPVRALAEVASPLAHLSSATAADADAALAAEVEREQAGRASLLEDLVRFAEPTGALREGRRLVPGAVVGRPSGARDRLVVRVPPAERIERGDPVVSGDVFVGRVAAVHDAGELEVELVTSKRFHVGALRPADDAQSEFVRLIVGGLDPGSRSASEHGLLLAVHAPSDREVLPGPVVVSELAVGDDAAGHAAAIAALADGFRLGRLVRLDGRLCVLPELDYRDGLFQVTVLRPPDASLPPVALEEELVDDKWQFARALSRGDPSPWRSTIVVDAGAARGVREGAALVSGLRLLGRVSRVDAWRADVALLDDPGLSLVCVARIEGVAEPRVLGRLVSEGRDDETGELLFSWEDLVGAGVDARSAGRVATLYTGSGDEGLPRGLLVGTTTLPVEQAVGPHRLRVVDGVHPTEVSRMWVRAGSARAGGSSLSPEGDR